MKTLLNLLFPNRVLIDETFTNNHGENVNVQVRCNGWKIIYPEGYVYYKGVRKLPEYYLRDVREFMNDNTSF